MTTRYRELYKILLWFYPKPFRRRFGEGMEQTFNDMCRDRNEAGHGLLAFAIQTFVETSAGIFREWVTVAMTQKRLVRIALVTVILLMVPLVAMQFTDEVVWDSTDFAFGGTLLFGAGLAYELVARRADNTAYRVAVGLAVATALILVWVNLAVGIIGTENNPANLMYVGVLTVGFIGAVIARFRPRGMARAMFSTALAQALVSVIALIAFAPRVETGDGLVRTLVLNAVIVILFAGSAWMFRRAAAVRSLSENV